MGHIPKPRIPWILGKHRKSQSHTAEAQPEILDIAERENLGSAQPSSSTVESWNTSTGRESHGSQASQGPPEWQARQPVPEVAQISQHAAELEAARKNSSWRAISLNQQPQYIHPNTQQLFFADDARTNQATRENEAIALRKAEADAEKRMLERRQNASADNVRNLRELIRERYALDLYVWEKRGVLQANRKKIVPKCQRADRILQEIYFIVNDWEDDLFDKDELRLVKAIQAAMAPNQKEDGESGGPAIWGDLPPWDRIDESERRPRRRVVPSVRSDDTYQRFTQADPVTPLSRSSRQSSWELPSPRF